MDKLLWLLLIFRVLRVLAPYLLGVAGACVVFAIARPILSSGWMLLAFLFVTAYMVAAIKGSLGSGGPSARWHNRHQDHES